MLHRLRCNELSRAAELKLARMLDKATEAVQAQPNDSKLWPPGVAGGVCRSFGSGTR